MGSYNPFQPITSLSWTEGIKEYFSMEDDFVAIEGYKDSEKYLKLRQYVLKFLQIHSKDLPVEPEGFDAFIPYLALNYFDNFISRNGLPKIQKDVSRDLDLLATCCLLKAGTIRNPNFNSDEFMGKIQEGGLQFKEKKMKKMEVKIVNVLGKRVFPITPLCFLEYFATYSCCLYTHGNIQEFIIQSHADIYLAEFKPSVIAASALIVGIRKHLSDLEPDVKTRFMGDFRMELEQLDSCMDKMIRQCDKRKVPIKVSCLGKPDPGPSRSEVKAKLLETKVDPLGFIVNEMVGNAQTYGSFEFDWDYMSLPDPAQPSSSQDIATKASSSALAGSSVAEASSSAVAGSSVAEASSSALAGSLVAEASSSAVAGSSVAEASSSALAGSLVAEASSSGLAGSSVAEASSSSSKEVRDDYAERFRGFGFAINWVDETEEVEFEPAADSKRKGKLFSVMGFSCLKPQPDPDRSR